MGGAGEMVRGFGSKTLLLLGSAFLSGMLPGGEGHVEEVKDGSRGCVLPF